MAINKLNLEKGFSNIINKFDEKENNIFLKQESLEGSGKKEATTSEDFSSLAGGEYGSFEIQKYLYETGLQNIFNDYNKMIGRLEESKQKEIEDAYYVRELSKKYLGEYASNVGIGDVSGQLLDIYGQYQANIGQINQYNKELQEGLEASYLDKKQQYELGLMETQLGLEEAKAQDEKMAQMQEIIYNIAYGNVPEGMTDEEYLQQNWSKLDPTTAWQLRYELAERKELEGQEEKIGQFLYDYNIYKETGKLPEGYESMKDLLEENKKILGSTYWDLKTEIDLESMAKDLVDKVNDILKMNKEEREEALSKLSESERKQVEDYIMAKEYGTFTLTSDSYTYFLPKGVAKENGRTFLSENEKLYLVETENYIDDSSSEFEDINKEAQDREIVDGTPFGYRGSWYISEVVEGERRFTQLYQATSPTNSIVVDKETQEERFETIKESLDKNNVEKSSTGYKAYSYDEKGNLVLYLDFTASEVSGFVINGISYMPTGVFSSFNVKDSWDSSNNNWKSKKSPSGEMASIMNEFINVYFSDDKKEFSNYMKTVSKKTKLNETMIIEHNEKYYAMAKGQIWELKK